MGSTPSTEMYFRYYQCWWPATRTRRWPAPRPYILPCAGVPVTIYQGQLDLICCTLGVDAWLKRLKWPGLPAFQAAPHEPFYAHGGRRGGDKTAGFMRRHQNLAMYYVMSAGAHGKQGQFRHLTVCPGLASSCSRS